MHYLDMSFKSTKSFINEDFLLQNKISKIVYHDYATSMPIIDCHNHISPKIISDNKPFSSINSVWLDEDHYKWRVMRALGIDENEITGDAPEKLKFKRWAQAVPYTVRNPLIPFFIVMIFSLFLVTYIPALSLFLPELFNL